MADGNEIPTPRPRYRWPWFVLALFLLGAVLAVLWMTHEVSRLREYRQTPWAPDSTNPPRVPRRALPGHARSPRLKRRGNQPLL